MILIWKVYILQEFQSSVYRPNLHYSVIYASADDESSTDKDLTAFITKTLYASESEVLQGFG